MINLLPPKYKGDILIEKKWKLILNLEIFLLAFLVCAFLVILIVRIATNGLTEAQTILTEMEGDSLKIEEQKREGVDLESLEKNIREMNRIIIKTNSFFKERVDLTSIIESFSKILPSGSYLTSFSYQEDSSKVSISGSCPNRDKMIELKENIESREDIKNLSFPSSNWLNPEKFSLTFEINE